MLGEALHSPRRRLVCNPVDLSYRYQEVVPDGDPDARIVFREGADPSVVRHHGRYFMFVSMSRGFWYSAWIHRRGAAAVLTSFGDRASGHGRG